MRPNELVSAITEPVTITIEGDLFQAAKQAFEERIAAFNPRGVIHTPLGGPKITLRIDDSGTSACWGHWVESMAAKQVLGSPPPVPAEADGDRGIVWGGSAPYGKNLTAPSPQPMTESA